MGYELHITRAAHWTDSPAVPIAPAEWDAVVARHPQVDSAGAPEEYVVWLGDEEDVMLWPENGQITVRLLGEDVDLLVTLAEQLGARVVGDDGETYLRGGAVRHG